MIDCWRPRIRTLLIALFALYPLRPFGADVATPEHLRLGRVRLLVVSPHPDDATLGAGGLIRRLAADSVPVQVVQLTGGDAFPTGVRMLYPGTSTPTATSYRCYGSVREREAIRAMRMLGVRRTQIRLLGFPDEGLCALASTYRTGPAAFESPYTKRDSPPDSEQVVRGTAYRGDDLVRELTRLIQDFRPTLVVVPHSGDQHPDHCAAHLLTHQAIADAVAAGVRAPRVLHYVIHYPDWPAPEKAAAGFEPPTSARTREWRWLTLPLDHREQAAKRRALDQFHSQLLVMADFLHQFVRTNELFIEGEPPLPIPCWCSGVDIAVGTRAVH